MGNNESVVCGKKSKKNTNNEEEQLGEPEDEEQMEDIDDGVLIANNKDHYFSKDDYEEIARKFPDDKGWMSPSMTMSKSKTKAKRIKWKEGDIIGNGSFGRVIMGLNLQTGSIMAVKQVQIGATNTQAQQERIKALELEIELLSQLSHKNIVSYFGSQRTKTNFNIFLEYISGGTIASLIEKYGPLNENLIRVYTRQILEGLEYLHVRNTIHRDIKGANVLVDNTGVCKLADFGTAKRISSIVEGETRYMPSIRGTVNWMAPEVIKQTTLGRHADIWSVGCTVLEMATGKIPWSHLIKPNATQISTLYQIATSKTHPQIPDGLSPEATDFLKQCFKINPQERSNVMELLNHRFLVPGDVIERPIAIETKPRGKSITTPINNTKHKKSDSGNQKSLPKPDNTVTTTTTVTGGKNASGDYAKYKVDSITNLKTELEETKMNTEYIKQQQQSNHNNHHRDRETKKSRETKDLQDMMKPDTFRGHRKKKESKEFQDFKQAKEEDLDRSILVPQTEIQQKDQKLEVFKFDLRTTLADNSILDHTNKLDAYAEMPTTDRLGERNFSTPAPLIIANDILGNKQIPFHHSNSETAIAPTYSKQLQQLQQLQSTSPIERLEPANSPTIFDVTKTENSVSDFDLKRIDPARLAKRKSRLRPLGRTDHLNLTGSRQALPNEEELSVNYSGMENASRKSSDNFNGGDILGFQRHEERKRSHFGGGSKDFQGDPEEAQMNRALYYAKLDRSPGMTSKTSQTISNTESDLDSNFQHQQQSNQSTLENLNNPAINIMSSAPFGHHKKSVSMKNIPGRGAMTSRIIHEVHVDHENYSDSTADPFGQGLSALKTTDKLSQFGKEQDYLEVTPARKLTGGNDMISETKEKFFAKKGRPFRSARQMGVKRGILIDYNTPRKEESEREQHGDYFIRIGDEAKNEEKVIIGSPYQKNDSQSPMRLTGSAIKEQLSAKEETPTSRNGWLEGAWSGVAVEGDGLNLNPEQNEMKATYQKKQYVS